jgi:hypothetical protein
MATRAWVTGPVADGAFLQSIAANYEPEMTLAEVADPGAFIITSDAGVYPQETSVGTTAYPDICALECGNSVCGWADWEECADWAAECGLYRVAPSDGSFLLYPSLRFPYARHRAYGGPGVPSWSRNGVLIGLLDGHVTWIASETLVTDTRDGRLEGIELWGPGSRCSLEEWADQSGGQPTLW